MSKELVITTTKMSIHREGDNPVYGESVIEVELDDECGGPFLVIRSLQDNLEHNTIRLEYEEIQKVLEVASRLIRQDTLKEIQND